MKIDSLSTHSHADGELGEGSQSMKYISGAWKQKSIATSLV